MSRTATPETLTALARLLARNRKRAVFVPDSDGPERASARQVLIDIGRIRGLGTISRKGRARQIGTGCTFGELLRSIDGENGLLMQAVSMMANPLVRNRVTVLAALDPESHYFDLATALVSLRARVRLQGPASSRTLGIGDFLLAAAEGFRRGEYPSMVEFDALEEGLHPGFFRVNPGPGKSTVSASVLTRLRRNVALDPEIAVSSSTVIPVPVPRASKLLARQALTDANVKKAAETAAAEMLEMAEIEDGGDPYERSLVEVAVSRALRRLLESPEAAQSIR
jgi:carbon-monoxide dehydrogenase medium subunit